MNLSAPFINRPVMTTLMMVAILLFGILAFKKMPISDLPNIDYPTIVVTANLPGGNPEYMANTVAYPLERKFTTISGLNTMTSNSIQGQTQITLNFNLGVDLDAAQVEVQSAISTALPNLPPMPNNPTFEKSNPSQTPILFLVLTSASLTLADLYEQGYNFLAQPLSMIDGVSQVQVYGYPFAVRVQADPMLLKAYDIDLNELSAALVNSNPNLPSGTLDGTHRNFTIESLGQLSTGTEYNKVIVKDVKELPLRVENVGQAVNAVEDRYPYFNYISQDKNQTTVVLAVSRQPGSNTLQISKAIFEALPRLENSLPSAVSLKIFYDKSRMITASVKEVEFTLVIALVLVVLVIFLYLGKLSETIIPSLVLPLALIGTFIAMYLLGFSVDNLSLLALILAIGFVVDDSIVVLENIVRHVEMGKPAFQAAMEGSRQISMTVLSMTFALSAVFIPMVFMPGILGKIFHELSLTIVVAIFFSGFISLSLNPMLCSRFLKWRKEEKRFWAHRMNDKLVAGYMGLLKYSIRFKFLTLLAGILCLVFSLVLLRTLPTDFLPSGNIDLIEGLTQADEGSSPLNTIKHQNAVNEVVRKNPYQDGFVTIAGYPTDDQGVLFIHLLPANKRPDSKKMIQTMQKELFSIPGMNTYLKPTPLIELQVGNSSSLGEYQYTLQSTNADELYRYAALLTAKMRTIPELMGVNNDMRIRSPQVRLNILRDQASTYGLTAQDIEMTLQNAYSGGRISTFNKGSNLYNLIVEVVPKFDLTKELQHLYIKSKKTNQLVPLSSVAEWSEVVAPSSVNHSNIFPSVTISFNLIQGAALGTAIEKIHEAAKEILPSNIQGEVQGSAQVFIETFKNMRWLIIIAIAIIYIVLGILYESFLHPLTILSALPVASFGGLLTLLLFKEPLSLYSVVGLFILIGLVQKNGIMMVDFALEYLKKNNETAQQAILEACRARFRPILMTTLAAMMGALPIAIGFGENGRSNRPLGLVVLGGLIFSQLLTLFVTPVVFLYLQRTKEFFEKKNYNESRDET